MVFRWCSDDSLVHQATSHYLNQILHHYIMVFRWWLGAIRQQAITWIRYSVTRPQWVNNDCMMVNPMTLFSVTCWVHLQAICCHLSGWFSTSYLWNEGGCHAAFITNIRLLTSSHNPQTPGDAWVQGKHMRAGRNVWVRGDAWVREDAWVPWDAWVRGDAWVWGDAWVRSQHYGNWCPGAKAPGHQYREGPVSYKNIALMVHNIRK